MLFEPGNRNLPANVVYDPAPGRPDDQILVLLKRVAHSIFALKGQRHHDQELRECSRWVTEETLRMFNAEVPRQLTGGRTIIFSTIMVHRNHLPDGYLASMALPLVINPAETPMAMILPYEYWPDDDES
jgi:hypothetical protein